MSENDYGIEIGEIGVPKEDGESWDEAAERLRRERTRWFDCPCGAAYRSRRAAIRCCSDRFDDDVDLPPIEDDCASDDDVRDALDESI